MTSRRASWRWAWRVTIPASYSISIRARCRVYSEAAEKGAVAAFQRRGSSRYDTSRHYSLVR